MGQSKVICLDTGILIDYYRKTIKERSFWSILRKEYNEFSVSVITQYEIFAGSNESKDEYWRPVFNKFSILPITPEICTIAIDIKRNLKIKRKSIDSMDLFIAATCIKHKLPLATLNVKHFENIDHLEIIQQNNP